MSGFLRAGRWLTARAENVLAAMLALMFVLFILQIIFRYVLNLSGGWAYELSAILWVWIVLFGASFVLRKRDEVRLDIIYSSVAPRVRRVMTLIFALATVTLLCIGLPAIADYVLFMKIERTAYLKLRYDHVYSIFIVFTVVTIIRYIWIAGVAVWGKDDDEESPAQ
ncbi:TRAP transporter small permease [Pelagibacterium luteolum]|uniref:TRAP transporter small permease protein n=1 Tax=Pelagibacterium luteolum TaxID=440168 RepID=A0A1G7VEI8_9HYPH|nr:TRAP transporter small permease subunit [Pelagibacterium luteolum]SDG58164.1 TRAP-type C4-dicarboxylate transport system, small permease component [Pelagibacterium luteolum]